MSLIICSECGKEISDKSSMCIHCGCPINKIKKLNTSKIFTYMCMSDTCLSNPFKEFDEYKGDILTCPDCGGQIEYYETEIIDNDNELVVERSIEESSNIQQNIQTLNVPKCPTCDSTNVQKIGSIERGASITFWGLFSKKINKSFKCKNCGYIW